MKGRTCFVSATAAYRYLCPAHQLEQRFGVMLDDDSNAQVIVRFESSI